MLIRFSVQNFLSFMSGVSLSLESEPITELEDTHTFTVGPFKLLKSSVIYGANASGKSNLLNAMDVMKDIVLNSSKESNATEDFKVIPFRLSSLTENEPTVFEMEFIQDNKMYRYGFALDATKIHEEWLYQQAYKEKNKEIQLFSRKGNDITMSNRGSLFQEGKGLEEKTRHNALFLSVVANFNGAISQSIQQWFQNITFISGARNNSMRYTSKMLQDQKHKDKILKLLQAADIGIVDLYVDERELDNSMLENLVFKNISFSKDLNLFKSELLMSSRVKYDKDDQEIGIEMFNVNQFESEGTKKFLSLVGPIIDKLEHGGLLIIDELDAKMHPLLTRKIVELFNSYDINYHHAQLIYVTHDVTNLSNMLFRRDQLWFVEKNGRGSSDLYSLADYRDEDNKKTRKDATYAKEYLLGKYGGIPKFRSWNLAMEGHDGNP
ncbi:MAG: abortive infection protein [Paenibacillus sp.]|nr:abortive infection protein [Paenibacillus sp.]